MISPERIIKKIEQDLKIVFDGNYFSNGYSIENGVITRLNLAHLHFENFDVLSPLFNTVKELVFEDDCIFNHENIAHDFNKFTALESLSIHVNSIKTTNQILSLSELKELKIFIDPNLLQKESITFDLKGLKSIQFLFISSGNYDSKPIIFEGMEHLSNLKKLWLECDCSIKEVDTIKNLEYLSIENVELKNIPTIESLKTLVLYVEEDYEVHSLEKFPNLESLEIQGCRHISLGRLSKLKVLVIQYQGFDLETTNCFDHLPNLEQLRLSTSDISVIKNIDKLTNLKILDLSENLIESLEGLENVVNLERLNLYDNKVSDISLLNKLPNLYEVNISCNDIEKEDVDNQINNPKIIKWLSLPAIPFIISVDRRS